MRYTYNELVNEGIKIPLGGHTYTISDIEDTAEESAIGYGQDESGKDYDLQFDREPGYDFDSYKLINAELAQHAKIDG
jgi:hypothetical protein